MEPSQKGGLKKDRHERHVKEISRQQRSTAEPLVLPYSDRRALRIAKRLKADSTSPIPLKKVATWLQRGDLSKRNASKIFNILQSAGTRTTAMSSELENFDEEVLSFKRANRVRKHRVLFKFDEVKRLMSLFQEKKFEKFFSKNQRKKIDAWKTLAMSIKNVHNISSDEEDMEEEDERPVGERSAHQLKERNEELHRQVGSYKTQLSALVRETEKKESDFHRQLEECNSKISDLGRDAEKKDNDIKELKKASLEKESEVQALKKTISVWQHLVR